MDYYAILEVNNTASEEVIRAAYKALVKKYHPDNYNGSDSQREKDIKIINEASRRRLRMFLMLQKHRPGTTSSFSRKIASA